MKAKICPRMRLLPRWIGPAALLLALAACAGAGAPASSPGLVATNSAASAASKPAVASTSAAPASSKPAVSVVAASSNVAGSAGAKAAPKPSAIISAAPAGSASGGPATKITICIPSRSTTTLPAFAAQQGGLLQAQHLDATFPYFAGAQVDAAMAAGQCNMEMAAGAVGPLLQGVDMRMVAVTLNRSPFQIWGQPKLSSIADLKGGTLADSGPGSLSWRIGRYYLQLNHLTADKDVTLTSTGADTVTIAALVAGRVDAAVLNFPGYLQAQQRGMKLLYKPPAGLRFVSQGIATSGPYLAQHRDIMRNVVKSVVDSMTRMKSDSNFYAAELNKYTGLSLDPAAVQTYWKTDTASYNIPPRSDHQSAVAALSLYSDTSRGQNLDAIANRWLDMSIVNELYPASS
ncbi:MAG TPA: ABC transporter substrate-binding protein [Chloroflexota bacterium]|nr:ABC transporter substrate-binding protein [Chloroflexota bacterium]